MVKVHSRAEGTVHVTAAFLKDYVKNVKAKFFVVSHNFKKVDNSRSMRKPLRASQERFTRSERLEEKV